MSTPRLKAPGGACDCHMHIYENRYPLASTATFKPPHAPVRAYLEVQRRLGLERMVVVQPSAYGFDNSCTLTAVAALGSRARGIAVVPPDVSDDELARLAAAGVKGIRYFMLAGGVVGWDTLERMALRVAPLGWHVQLQVDGRTLPDHESLLKGLPCALVIEHNGKFLEPVSTDHRAFRALQRLLDGGRCWVKVSAPYETSVSGPPHYEDVARIAKALIRTNPERCLWASNWPHPNQTTLPDDALLLDLLLEWAGSDDARRRMLVDNPAELYGF